MRAMRLTVHGDMEDGRRVEVEATVRPGYPASWDDPGEGPSAELEGAWWVHGDRRCSSLDLETLDEVWPGWEDEAIADGEAAWEDEEDQRAEMEREDMERWL